MNLDRTVTARVGPAALLLALLCTAPLVAQQPASGSSRAGETDLRGTVVKDDRPVAGVEVTLHRVAEGASGVVAQNTTDAAGDFFFSLPAADSGSFNVYFTTTDFHTVRYFGRAVHPADEIGDYRLEVFDTASVLPEPIRLSRRDMVLVPQPGGGWEVDEIVRLHNPNRRTLVSAGASPSWDLRIPAGVEAFEVGEGEIPADQVQRMENRILLMMPVTPGDRELFIRYRIPASMDDAELPLSIPVDTFNLFVRQPSPRIGVVGMASTSMVNVGEERFLRYAATGLAPGSQIDLEWESVAPPLDPVVAAVGLTVVLLAIGAFVAARSGRSAAKGALRQPAGEVPTPSP